MSNYEHDKTEKPNLLARVRAALGKLANEPLTDESGVSGAQIVAGNAGNAEKASEAARMLQRFNNILAGVPKLPAEGVVNVRGTIRQETTPGSEFRLVEPQQPVSPVFAHYPVGAEEGTPATKISILNVAGPSQAELPAEEFYVEGNVVVREITKVRETATGQFNSKVERVPGEPVRNYPAGDGDLNYLESRLGQVEWPPTENPANPALPPGRPALPGGQQ